MVVGSFTDAQAIIAFPFQLMTGLFFGSFNPIHTGHLIIAEFVRQQVKLDEVWFIVSPQNPFKAEQSLLPQKERLHLLKLAISGNEHFVASDIEFRLPKPSYSIHTLELLARKYPDKEFALIMGSDNLRLFEQWKDYEKIIDNYRVLVYDRNKPVAMAAVQHPNLLFIEAPYLDISSTLIRKMLLEKKSIRYLVPEKVAAYIYKHDLYR